MLDASLVNRVSEALPASHLWLQRALAAQATSYRSKVGELEQLADRPSGSAADAETGGIDA